MVETCENEMCIASVRRCEVRIVERPKKYLGEVIR